MVAPAGNENLSNAAMLARLMRRDEFVGAVALLAASACVEKPRAAPTPSPDAAQTVAPAPSQTASSDAQTRGDARTPVDAEVDAATAAAASYGAFRRSPRAGCLALAKGSGPRWLAEADLRGSFVDGDDLLALVNRSPQGALPPDYAPRDMVDIARFQPRTPADCDKYQCIRREAGDGLRPLLAAMAREGFPAHIDSVYRSYAMQCQTFQGWVKRSEFCAATEQSALPGHSQHQLGTTIDLFTQAWKAGGATVFRQGFGCTKPGRWLQEHSWEFGFVFPYPIHPDDLHEKDDCVARSDHVVPINPKTGYRYEHWHLRYIGKEHAAAFHAALLASGPRSPSALTLEQWIRGRRGLVGDTELPVCDGCNCGACSTLASAESACGGRALAVGESGAALPASGAPTLVSARRATDAEAGRWAGTVLAVEVDVPERTLTQPPFVGLPGAGLVGMPGFADVGTTTHAFVPLPKTAPRDYPALPRALRVGARAAGGGEFVYAAGLADAAVGSVYNRANLLVPAPVGKKVYMLPLPKLDGPLEVTLLLGGEPAPGAPVLRVN